MKKKILLVVAFLFGVFISFSSVDALTKINFQEQSNGKINTTLHFEEGFVGGIDITFKIKGDVSVNGFNFSNKIVSGNYEKEWEYDKEKKTLKVQVTTGGIGTSHNLLNEKKELALGVINFTTSSKENVDYELIETAFKIVDNNWDSQTIEQSHITLGEQSKFVYKVKNDTVSEEENSDNDVTKDDENSKNSENKTNSKNEQQKNEEVNNEKNELTPEKTLEENKEVDDSESKNDDKINDDKNTTDNNVASEKAKDEKDNFSWIVVPISLVFLMIGICGIYLVFSKNKKKNNK